MAGMAISFYESAMSFTNPAPNPSHLKNIPVTFLPQPPLLQLLLVATVQNRL